MHAPPVPRLVEGASMAGPLPVPVTVTPPQQAVLEGLLRQHSCPQALAFRARIILAAATGQRNEPLARQLVTTVTTVRKWRARWAAAATQLAAVDDDPRELQQYQLKTM